AMPPPPMPLARFAVIGDYGVDTRDEMDVAKLVRSWHPEYVVTVGDNNYPSGEATTIDANIGQYFSAYIGGYTGKYGPGSVGNRFWPCLGNHDWYSATGAQPYLDYFPSLPGNHRYYDVVIGTVHFFSVDSDPHEPDGIDAISPQARWLQTALAASQQCFNVVYFHHPAYSSGDPAFTETQMRWPFADWGADVVLTGHQHQYERLAVGGLTYVVDGLGGALNRFDFAAIDPGSLVRYNASFGALFVEVLDGTLSFTFRNTLGVVVDRFEVKRDCSTPHTIVDAGG
ncbi:MAG TPA: metallophosphoesterase, partial [Polyangia bacterium]|nr:metallophosphoesterase [Polyangia bacterium]